MAVLIVGDYTTRIGDPSGRSSERPVLSDEEIDANAKRYFEQAALVIDTDPAKLEVRFNGEWLAQLDFAEVLRLTRTITVARILERDDFANRFAAQAPISVSELLYPLMQAYDSVAVEADVELGGHRPALQPPHRPRRHGGVRPRAAGRAHDAAAARLRRREDGKSKGNTIGLTDPPEEQFGKTMRISDEALAGVLPARHGDRPAGATAPIRSRRSSPWRGSSSRARTGRRRPRRRRRISRASSARARRPTRFRRSSSTAGRRPVHLPALLVDHLGVESTSAARRLIAQGAVKVGDETVTRDGFACRAPGRRDRPGGKAAICTGFCRPPQFLTALPSTATIVRLLF